MSSYIDVGESDFEERVIARSAELPVVVDFWAAWCQPCRALAPLLEKEVAALDGRVLLAKVDTDAHPGLAARYQIRGIPAVKAFRDGKVVDEFVGAQPAAVVRAFLSSLAPSPEKLALAAATAAAAAGDLETAERGARALGAAGALLLAEVLLRAGRPAEVEAALAALDPRSLELEHADKLRAIAAFATEPRALDQAAAAAAPPDDLEARWALAGGLAARAQPAQAIEQLLEIIARSRRFRDGAGLRAALALFAHPALDADTARELRRRLQIVT